MKDYVDVRTLVKKRDIDSANKTKEILAHLHDKLSRAAKLYIKADKEVAWFSIEKIDGLDTYAKISGRVVLEQGDVVATEDGPMVIDENNINSFQNVLTFYIPYELLDYGTHTEIYDHIMNIQKAAETMGPEEMFEYLRNANDLTTARLLSDDSLDAILDQVTRPERVEDFSTRSLSDEQITQVKALAEESKRRVN